MKWNQYQANGANTGFITVHTQPLTNPTWRREIGPIGYASPVLGPDGTIYIGTLDGKLFAINPSDGQIRWQLELKPGLSTSIISASPAVDKEGNIYVIDTYIRREADHRIGEDEYRLKMDSTLYCYNDLGRKQWSFRFPGGEDSRTTKKYTKCAPKLLYNDNDTVTLFMNMTTTEGANTVHYVMAIDANGNLLEKRKHSSYPPEPITGSTDWGGIWDAIWDFISSPVDFDESGIAPEGPYNRQDYLELVKSPGPSVAITTNLSNSQNPVIIVEDGVRKLAAYRWLNNDLQQIWNKSNQDFRYRSSPVICPDATIAIGQGDGKVVIYNAADGQPFFEPWIKAGKIILSPVVTFGRQLYAAAGDAFTAIDRGNEIYGQTTFAGNPRALGAPALSLDYCYLMTMYGLHTYSFEAVKISTVNEFPGGASTPAIADDGSVYAVDFKGILWAFNRPGTISVRPIEL